MRSRQMILNDMPRKSSLQARPSVDELKLEVLLDIRELLLNASLVTSLQIQEMGNPTGELNPYEKEETALRLAQKKNIVAKADELIKNSDSLVNVWAQTSLLEDDHQNG